MAQLTPREQDVLAGVSRGRSNKEIATALAIAENTVKSTLARILEKLHLDNRVQAAIYAISHGLPDEAGGPDLPADRSSSRRPG
jgi:DNA-binding NarL/FixJ family response regulator